VQLTDPDGFGMVYNFAATPKRDWPREYPRIKKFPKSEPHVLRFTNLLCPCARGWIE